MGRLEVGVMQKLRQGEKHPVQVVIVQFNHHYHTKQNRHGR